MSEVSISFDADDVLTLYTEVDRSLADFMPVFNDIINLVLIPSHQKTFSAEGRPERWPELNPDYASYKRRKLGHDDMLVFSGDLRDSLCTETGNQHSVREMGEKEMAFGTTRPWAKVHQDGDGSHPQREHVLWQDEDGEQAMELARDFVIGVGRYAVR